MSEIAGKYSIIFLVLMINVLYPQQISIDKFNRMEDFYNRISTDYSKLLADWGKPDETNFFSYDGTTIASYKLKNHKYGEYIFHSQNNKIFKIDFYTRENNEESTKILFDKISNLFLNDNFKEKTLPPDGINLTVKIFRKNNIVINHSIFPWVDDNILTIDVVVTNE